MAKKTDSQLGKIEREYVIPLREKYRHVPRYKKTPKAIKEIKLFLAKHMRVRDRDLNKIKLDGFINEFMWARGIKNPMHKVKVKVVKDKDGIVRAELVDLPNKLKFKKARAEKLSQEAQKVAKKKKDEKLINDAQQVPEEIKEEAMKKEKLEEKSETKNEEVKEKKEVEKPEQKVVKETEKTEKQKKVEKHKTESKEKEDKSRKRKVEGKKLEDKKA